MTAPALTLYTYWRSSASWRVRLALAWKRLDWQAVPVNLLAGGQRAPEYLALNPQGLVPALAADGALLTQSLAIMEYLEETHPAPPLLPADALGRARVRAACQLVAADVHPLANLRVRQQLQAMGNDNAALDGWARHWIAPGLTALEGLAAQHDGPWLCGAQLTMADLVLVPQLYNARRVGLPLTGCPRLLAIESAVAADKFLAAMHPERQLDRI
jgi:maleylacetoacetate isomerase